MAEDKKHSAQYQTLKKKWDMEYITLETLAGYVLLNSRNKAKGITAEEFEQITGRKYEASEA